MIQWPRLSASQAAGVGLIAVFAGFGIWLFWDLDWSKPGEFALLVEYVFFVCFVFAALGALFLRRYRRRILGGMVAGYFLIYAALAFNGQYDWSQSGHLRYGGGLSVTDRVVWNPRLTWWEPFRDVTGQDTTRGNLLGYLYSPLISLNRQWVHPTQVLFDKDGGGKLDSRIDLGRLGVKAR